MKSQRQSKFRFRRLLMVGLCNLTSGIFFGTGCLIAERIDSNWVQSKEASSTKAAQTSMENEP
jgi:hypothetical protein